MSASAQIPEVFYGEDDRFEVDLYPDSYYREAAMSVAGRVQGWHLSRSPEDPTFFDFPKRTLMHGAEPLCHDERFAEQRILPDCSAFLITPDTLVTAGHCVPTPSSCRKFKWVFGYKEGVDKIHEDNIYGCKEIIDQKIETDDSKVLDYAVIKLKREVVGRKPLPIRKYGKLRGNVPLVVIGHPSGLPMKISGNGKSKAFNNTEPTSKFNLFTFLKQRYYYFSADLDTFTGNSGSPVFNERTGNVEGIIIEGAEDYIEDVPAKCYRPAVRKKTKFFGGEKVFRINRIPFVQDLLTKSLQTTM